ncbi:hypothetical protein AB3N61_09355 [Leptospira sp. WS58.C1]|uniref:hypothetical protein n=1 Tax=Leptospira cinconiae TaxID=3235173 RepID=UPI00349E7E18
MTVLKAADNPAREYEAARLPDLSVVKTKEKGITRERISRLLNDLDCIVGHRLKMEDLSSYGILVLDLERMRTGMNYFEDSDEVLKGAERIARDRARAGLAKIIDDLTLVLQKL